MTCDSELWGFIEYIIVSNYRSCLLERGTKRAETLYPKALNLNVFSDSVVMASRSCCGKKLALDKNKSQDFRDSTKFSETILGNGNGLMLDKLEPPQFACGS